MGTIFMLHNYRGVVYIIMDLCNTYPSDSFLYLIRLYMCAYTHARLSFDSNLQICSRHNYGKSYYVDAHEFSLEKCHLVPESGQNRIV